ncbi:MAG TPA: hypothetical protein VGI61_10845, partial [Parafilimonas sp.]
MIVFKNEDKAYQKWVKENSYGFVVNTRNEKGHEYRVAHKTSCRFISNIKNPARSTKNYIKVCATDPLDIARWFYQNKSFFNGKFYECGHCKPNINVLISGDAYLFGDEIETASTYLEGDV